MNLNKINPTSTAAWQKLRAHFSEIEFQSTKDLFKDENRVTNFSIEWNDFYVDFSKNNWTKETIYLLLELANEVDLKKAIESYFIGEKINETENRAVLHTALRATKTEEIFVDGINIIPEVFDTKLKIQKCTETVLSGNAKGYTGKTFTDVVNIGIGGSDLGPDMVVEALQYYKTNLNVHFVSNIDGDHVQEILKKVNPETTLFIIVSKTFTTQETLTNAETIKKWFLKNASEKDISKHFVAVTSNEEKAVSFGIISENIFPMWDWVGGRFSLWSAVGLSISLAVGYDNFEKLLSGANKMDVHFRTSDFNQNIPVILALLSVWHNNFFGAETEAIVPYTQYLHKLAPYLQQGMMESNGKSVDRNGFPVNYQTGTVIWGEPGSNAQHAFFQLIHQGTKLIPTDFIGFIKPLHNEKDHHNKLMSNFFAQTEALLMGKSSDEVLAECLALGKSEADIKELLPFKTFEGNKPTNTILINQLTPENLGSLIAMYEHKIFVQGIIWNIYSYDQWGVELGKKLANSILDEIENNEVKSHDSSTTALLQKFLGKR
ncbi:glucose-6-phosphate isomerase [Flavobacterium urocaniciphilum]|uniref:Glucose-6-phosphate isomerase n=1 Tax=Flavobacterium urocaniciphilum TaxID=1299341 RepID=A0A1H9BKP7_9FLAO|nr:glucose-6-phosphate isomerase [Flavobacterium urocaniciphilum]SEP89536.1 glucose-6-phosphate isomerase [Flavobacterium urocaniciphilum]